MRSPNARLRWTDAGEAALSNEGLEKEVAMIILRYIATLLSGPCVLIGAIWILQGVNVLPGSFMTGDIKWSVIGTCLAGVGAMLAFWVNRRRAT